MKVVEFYNARGIIHYLIARYWLEKHAMSVELANELPEVGYVAYNHTEPVAMGFLRRVEGDVGMIDSLITNPYSAKVDRNVAMDAIFNQLIETAKEFGLKSLIGYSQDDNTLTRARRYGFSEQPYAVMSANLRSESA